MIVEQIPSNEAIPWILHKHYARRIPPIQFSFGLFEKKILTGIVTYGCPASMPLYKYICGPEWSPYVLELNRLCVDSKTKNASSFLVSNSLRLLPAPRIVVSYADTAQGHIGYIYQACNFLYTGESAKRKDFCADGTTKLHPRNTIDTYGTIANAKRVLGDKAGWIQRSQKHRYIYFVGNKKQKKEMRSKLRYRVVSKYPKGATLRYDASEKIPTQGVLF